MKTLLTFAGLMVLAFANADACPDFDDNGTVDTNDLFLFVQNFGTTEARYDLNADGTVNLADFLIFTSQWGKCALNLK